MLDFGLEGASSILAEIRDHIYFFHFFPEVFFCMMYVTQTPQTTNSTWAVRSACYYHLAVTLCVCSSHWTVIYFNTINSVPVGIQQQPVSVPILRSQRNMSFVVTKLRHSDTTLLLLCSKQSRQCNAMSSYWIRQARDTHNMKERQQKNKTEAENKETNRKKGKKTKQNCYTSTRQPPASRAETTSRVR